MPLSNPKRLETKISRFGFLIIKSFSTSVGTCTGASVERTKIAGRLPLDPSMLSETPSEARFPSSCVLVLSYGPTFERLSGFLQIIRKKTVSSTSCAFTILGLGDFKIYVFNLVSMQLEHGFTYTAALWIKPGIYCPGPFRSFPLKVSHLFSESTPVLLSAHAWTPWAVDPKLLAKRKEQCLIDDSTFIKFLFLAYSGQ